MGHFCWSEERRSLSDGARGSLFPGEHRSRQSLFYFPLSVVTSLKLFKNWSHLWPFLRTNDTKGRIKGRKWDWQSERTRYGGEEVGEQSGHIVPGRKWGWYPGPELPWLPGRTAEHVCLPHDFHKETGPFWWKPDFMQPFKKTLFTDTFSSCHLP